MKLRKKILVIGGGPAGLMTALSLQKQEQDVTLIDKSLWPIDKVCGEGIMPNGLAILKKYNILEKLNVNYSRPFYGITYIEDRQASAQFISDCGCVIRRTELSRVLYEENLKHGVSLLGETELVNFEQDQTAVKVIVRQQRFGEPYFLGTFDYLIGADGLRSKVRKIANFKTLKIRKQNRIGARIHYQLKPWSKNVEVYWNDFIECYVAPSSEDCVELIFCWNQDQIQIKTGHTELTLQRLLSYFPQLTSRVREARKTSDFELMGSFAVKATSPIENRVILIGDSSVFLDPITGEGLSLAFEQADLLGQCIQKIELKLVQEKFKKEIAKKAMRYIRITKIALFFSEHRRFRKVMFFLLNQNPWLFQHLLEVNIGSRGLLQFLNFQSHLKFRALIYNFMNYISLQFKKPLP